MLLSLPPVRTPCRVFAGIDVASCTENVSDEAFLFQKIAEEKRVICDAQYQFYGCTD